MTTAVRAFQCLPVVAGAKETRRQILLYTIVLVPLTLAPYLMGFSGLPYGITAGVLGLIVPDRVYRVMTDQQDAQGNSLTGDAPAKAAFKYSVLYLVCACSGRSRSIVWLDRRWARKRATYMQLSMPRPHAVAAAAAGLL